MSNNTNYWDHGDPPKEFFERVENSFQEYLFYKNLPDGKREVTCTACHKTFIMDPLLQKRTLEVEDVEFWRASVNDEILCPKCHKRAMVKNIKLMKSVPYQMKCNIAVLVHSPEDVWLVCYVSEKKSIDGKVKHSEVMFYHLVPGDSYQFKAWSTDAPLIRQKIIENPFTWHHGVYTEQYEYNVDLCGNDLEKTFLKYAFYDDKYRYTQKAYLYIPDVKYMCWFARHPQFEFLMKLGHAEVVKEIVDKHTDFKSLLNWEAKKPWELFNISHEEYKIWKEYKLDFSLYKVFRRLGVPGKKGWKLADDISNLVCGRMRWNIHVQACYNFIAKCKKVKVPPRDIVNYLYKTQRNSGGACWHCPGVTLGEVFNTWCDYIDLAVGAGKLKSINPMPKDLHDAHNRMVSAKKRNKNIKKDWKLEYKKCFEAGKNYSEEFAKKFPKVEKIYASLGEKYTYENDKYRIVVPKTIQEIFAECSYLRLCVCRPGVTRYWERVSRRESYMMFLRDKKNPDQPFYLIEVEPCGTIRQKRSFDDLQYSDIDEAVEFLKEWQAAIQKRMTSYDRRLAKKSREQRELDMNDLHEKKVTVRTGYLTGQLLADVLEADLMEVAMEETKLIEKKEVKVG